MPQRPDIEQLLSTMTLPEKAGQLNQAARDFEIKPDEIRTGRVGSLIYASSAYAGNESQERVRAKQVNAFQELATKESRLGIPLLIARDVIHGHRTVAPIPLGQAASWSPEDVGKVAEVAAREAYADGIRWVFTPMLDIARDPRWGRIAEGLGEDPYLGGMLAAAAVQGYQGEDMSAPGRVAACAKHFVGYGAAEGGRDYNVAEITPNTLRNIYLPPFHAAIRAGVATIMSSFNEIGGLPVTASHRLLTEILKDEWDWDGLVISDWNAVLELVEHGVAQDREHAGELAFNAGVDIDMTSYAYVDYLECLVCQGKVTMERVDDAVRRVLKLKSSLGLFENPYTDLSLAETTQFTPEHKNIVLNLARKSLTLLKNRDGILPIKRDFKKIGLFGPLIEARDVMNGTWCLDGEARDVTTILEAFQAYIGKDQELITGTLPDQSVSLSRYCDLAVAVVGEHQHRSGEANSITTLDLPPGQTEFLEAMKRTGVPLVVVVLAGRPLAIHRLEEFADAILYAWHPGCMGGQAIAEVLFGEVNPSGKTPVTFPRSLGQVPIYYNRKRTGRPLDPYARGESRYQDQRDSPLYPFGYGLSYSNFKYDNLRIEAVGEAFRVRVDITNTSPIAGEEIVQLYIRDRVSSATRPVKELKGFARQNIAAGSTSEVAIELVRDSFGFYGLDEKWVVEPGDFDIFVGPNSQEGLTGLLTLR